MIPKILHYCFGMTRDFGGQPWSLLHYVCVKSAVERLKPSKVYLWCEHIPTGPWWQLTEKMVDVVQIPAPREIFGNPLLHPAHRADVVRLDKLIEHGGIYLDADVFIQRDFDDLLDHHVVMGQQAENGNQGGLCNAVLLAEPNAPFLRRWREEYRTFRSRGRDQFWDEHSVRVPARLAGTFSEEITILPERAFFWPSFSGIGIARIFNSTEAIPETGLYANHLWETAAWLRYVRDLTPGRVRTIDSNFHTWARPFVSDLPDNYGTPGVVTRASRGIRRVASLARRPRRILSALWHAVNRFTSAVFPGTKPARLYRQRTFRNVYESRSWGMGKDGKYFSGVGSIGEPVSAYVEAMVPIIRNMTHELGDGATVVDLGCGDFAVGSALLAELPALRYIGCDIVPGLVAENERRYGSTNVSFRCLDMVSEQLPSGHIYLVRQVLQHLPNRDISRVLSKLKDCQCVFVTEGQPEFTEGPVNPDKPVGANVRYDWMTGRGRGVELDQKPYSVPVEEVCRVKSDPEMSREVIVTYRLWPQPAERAVEQLPELSRHL